MHELFIRSALEASLGPSPSSSSSTSNPQQETPQPVAATSVSASAPTSAANATTSGGGNFCHLPPVNNSDEASRRLASHRILRALLMHPRLRGLMPRLLAGLSDDGLTPFMLAVQCKAYQVASFLLDYLIVSLIGFLINLWQRHGFIQV